VLGRQSQSNAPARHGNNLVDDCCDTCRLLLTVWLQSESSMRLSALGHSAATRLSALHTASDLRRLKTARPGLLKHVPPAGSRHAVCGSLHTTRPKLEKLQAAGGYHAGAPISDGVTTRRERGHVDACREVFPRSVFWGTCPSPWR